MPKKKNKRLTAENKTEEVIEAFRQTSQRENSTDVLGSWTGNQRRRTTRAGRRRPVKISVPKTEEA